MAHPRTAELIWRGRIHLGDEPGIYGDANYAGLTTELPFMVFRSETVSGGSTSLRVRLEAKYVSTFDPYPGHIVCVIQHEPTDQADSSKAWTERELARLALKDKASEVVIPIDASYLSNRRNYLSIRVRVDTTIRPGLYNDFLVTALSIEAPGFNFFGAFGFAEPD
jgi:hypothetical protein